MSTILSVKDAAVLLSVSQQRVRTLCRDGELKAEKIGSTWIIEQSSLKRYSLKTSRIIAEDHNVVILNPKNKQKPIALSFFSGAMGLDLGIEKAGFDVRLACEVDKYCRQTIALNKPNTALLSDINSYQPKDILEAAQLTPEDEIDLIVGGPPCQAFSTAGKRQGFSDGRGNVFLKYLSLSFALKPKYLVIENVRGLMSCPLEHRPHDKRGSEYPALSQDELKGGALNYILSLLKAHGYSYSFNLYNSANFGTPQTRERLIIICSRDGSTPPFLVPTHSESGDFNLPKWKNLKSCLKNIEKHDHLTFPEKRLKYYRLLKAGQNWRALPIELQREAMGKSFYSGGGKTGFLRRLDWNKPSPTIVTHPTMPATDLAHPVEDRPLSIQEYKRIQEFPDSWLLAGPLMEQYKQIGNAVPLSLGYAVGKLVMNLIVGNEIPQFNNFKYSRYKQTSHTEWEEHFNSQLDKALLYSQRKAV